MLLLAFRYQVSAQTSSYVSSMLVLDPFPYPYLLPRQSRALCKCLQLKYYEQPITKQNHLPLHTHRNAGSEVSAGQSMHAACNRPYPLSTCMQEPTRGAPEIYVVTCLGSSAFRQGVEVLDEVPRGLSEHCE
ncbi:hypothetical protein HDV57DRAFT_486844 [Trichoderma longibrachiatum]